MAGAAVDGKSVVIRKIQMDPVVDIFIADAPKTIGSGGSVVNLETI